MKFVLSFVYGLCIVFGCMFPAFGSSELHVIEPGLENPLASSLSIQVRDSPYENWSTVASGTVIEGNPIFPRHNAYILTAQHVADGVSEHKEVRACLILNPDTCINLHSYIHNNYELVSGDWAVYPIKKLSKAFGTVRIRKSLPVLGEEIRIIGNPFGQRYISQGIVAFPEDDYLGIYYRINAFAAPGNSGGGVFDEEGRLIGIVSAIEIHQEPIYFGQFKTYNNMVLMSPVAYMNF